MSEKKESLKSHLINLLEIDENSISKESLEFLNTEIKRYRKFLQELKVQERDPEADKIYKALVGDDRTIVNLLAKKRGETVILNEMHRVYKAQYDYYQNKLKSTYKENAMKNSRSIGDAMIELQEQEYKNIISGYTDNVYNNKYYWDNYLQELDERWLEFVGYIDKILNMFFSSYYENEKKPNILLNAPTLGEAIGKEQQYYNRIKENYSSCRDDEKNDNPYKNLYMYYRNSYIRDFYKIELPDIGNLFEFKNYNLPFRKEKYTLEDIANIYKAMMELPDDKDVYENMKKLFQKLQYMDLFKTDGKYVFDNVSIPLAEYAYYRKKNHKESENIQLYKIDSLICDRYAPLLNVLILGDEEKIEAYKKMRQFILEEYYDMYSTLSNSYQDSMLSYLMESTVRIWALCSGLPFERVYDDWDYAFED